MLLYSSNLSCLNKYAGVAQSVEQLIRNQQVAGSNPVTSSTKKEKDTKVVLFFFANR